VTRGLKHVSGRVRGRLHRQLDQIETCSATTAMPWLPTFGGSCAAVPSWPQVTAPETPIQFANAAFSGLRNAVLIK
jgi:hypothetical protein